MKKKQIQKPAKLLAVVSSLLVMVGADMTARAQQVLTNAFYGPNSPAPNTAPGFNYVANGIVGDTNWDGVYLNAGDIPFGPTYSAATRASSGNAVTIAANTTSSGAIIPVDAQLPFPVPQALAINQNRGAWSGGSDSGFFIWKAVSGDFDVAVRSLYFQVSGSTFSGLLVRPWNTNNTGAAVDFNRTNGNENFIAFSRGQQFGAFNQTNPAILPSGGNSSIPGEDEIRISTNAGSTEEVFPDARYTNVVPFPQEFASGTDSQGNYAGTNQTRMYRIVRHQLTNFTFYVATNLGDPWTLLTNAGTSSASRGYTTTTGTIVRPDWTNALFQVGISSSSFAAASAPEYYDSFQITGTNLNLPSTTLVSSATGLTLVSTNSATGSATFTWTPGTYLDSTPANSLVIVRQDGHVIVSPISGAALPTPDANLADIRGTNQNNAQYGASNNVVVYEGSGNSVTISGLLNNTHTYTVAVYSYTNTSTYSILNGVAGNYTNATFNTAIDSTATNYVVGPGVVTNIVATVVPTSIPVNGAATVTLIGQFSTGDTQNLTTQPSVTLASSDPAITALNGVLSANAVTSGNTGPSGTGNIVIGFGGFFATNNVTSHLPVFTDNFSVPHDYKASNVVGSTWDGVYETNTDIAGVTLGSGPLTLTTFDADITSNNCLTIISANGWWKNADDNGAYLYKVAAGDFQCAVHLTGYGPGTGGGSNAITGRQIAYNFFGILARAFAASNNASPFGTGRTEDNVNWQHFDQGPSTDTFNTINGATTETTDMDGDTADWWMLMTRVNGTNFNLFKGPSYGGPWKFVRTAVQPALTNGVPVQIGLEAATYTGNFGTNNFDSFMLDGTNIVGTGLTAASVPTPATGVNVSTASTYTSATITWTEGTIPGQTGAAAEPTSVVVMKLGSPVSSQPYFGETLNASTTFGAGKNLGGGNFVVFAGQGSSVTVTGLTPGLQYYATVYEYAGSGAAKAFNEAGGVEGPETSLATYQGIAATASSTLIPVNGIGGSYQVLASFVGATSTLDVTSQTTLLSPNGIVNGTNGLFTGIGLGTENNLQFAFTPPGASTPLLSAPISVSTRNSTYYDYFSNNVNYLQLAQNANGNSSAATAGTIWDGILLGGTGAPAGYSIPGGNLGAGITTALDAGITATNTLTLVHVNDNWGGTGENDGFLLYKNVVGDFQASVFVTNMNIVDDQMSGIMVRAATPTGAGISATSGAENFVSDNEFENFGFVDVNRTEVNGTDNQLTGPNTFGSNGFLVVRTRGTNFTFYRRNGPTNAFVAIPGFTRNLAAMTSGQLVEVGPDSATYAGGTVGTTGFTQFMLDLTSGPLLNLATTGQNLTITWDASDSFNHLYSSTTVNGHYAVVNGVTITTANGTNSVTVPVGTGNVFYQVGP